MWLVWRAATKISSLAVALLLLTVVELYGGYLLWRNGFRYRVVEVASLQDLPSRPQRSLEAFRVGLANEPWKDSPNVEEKYIGALRWTMNQARAVGPNARMHDTEALLRSVQRGEGAICDNMVRLYGSALAAVGLPSRPVWLFTEMFGGDTHSVTEVLLENKWVLFDPTFGVYYRDAQGRLLSAQDIKQRLLFGAYKDIEPVFIAGGVSYPPRLETYYINYLPLFNNVFVEEDSPSDFWLLSVPPLRYWWGAKLYFQRLPAESAQYLVFAQRLYLLFIVVIPITLIALTAAIAFRIARAKRTLRTLTVAT